MSEQNENRYGEGFGGESNGQDQNANTQNANGYEQYEYSYTYENPKAEPIGPSYENSGFQEAGYGYQGEQYQGGQRQAEQYQGGQRQAEQYQGYTQNTGGQNYMYTTKVKHKKPKKKGRGPLIISVIALCLVAVALGGILTAYVILPMANSPLVNEEPQQQEQDVNQGASEPQTPQESVPQLGGEAPSNLGEYENPVVGVVENVGEAVVSVKSRVQNFIPGQQMVEQDTSFGSGFIISKEGHIVTNSHVVASGDEFVVALADGTEYKATLLGQDPTSDLAVIKIDPGDKDLVVAPIGDSNTVKVGEMAIAIGNPLGESLTGSVTVGYISALNRNVNVEGGTTNTFIQTDAAINPGNSGGPLVNTKGEVIGINAAKSYIAGYDDYGNQISAEGIGFAIPISDAMPIIQTLIENGRVAKPGIGINYFDISDADAEIWGVPKGAMVVAVTENGAADQAGIQKNDIITHCNGEAIDEQGELLSLIQSQNIGDVVTLTVYRNGQTREVQVTIEDMNA